MDIIGKNNLAKSFGRNFVEYFDAPPYMKIDDDGNERVAETVIYTGDLWRALPDVAVDSNDNPHVAFNDGDRIVLEGCNLADKGRVLPGNDDHWKTQVGFGKTQEFRALGRFGNAR